MTTTGHGNKGAEGLSEAPPAPVPDAGDGIAANRSVKYLLKDAVPPIPKGFRSVSITERRKRLTWVPAESVAELLAAARELLGRADRVPTELGDLAPKLDRLGGLVIRVEDIQATMAAAQAVVDSHSQLLELGLSDIDNVVSGSYDEYTHRVDRKPELVPYYTKVVTYGGLHGQAIIEGRARARETQALVDAATEAAQADAAAAQDAAANNAAPTASIAAPTPTSAKAAGKKTTAKAAKKK